MDKFASDFLKNYLRFGLGSMPKSDIDALVMHLIDLYGCNGLGPTGSLGNQEVSERLKTPLAKIKKLRYEAALKFGGNVEDQAKGRLLAALSKASLELEQDRICLIIEDSLAKNWLQGQLKANRQIFDNPFNTEIVRVSADGLFNALMGVFDKRELESFRVGYKQIKKKTNLEEQKRLFKNLAMKFAEGAAKKAGGGVVTALKSLVGI